MRMIRLFIPVLLTVPSLVFSQNATSEESLPFFEYWPVILLPIFVIVLYRYWKKRKNQ